MAAKSDYYDVLGISKSASEAEIKSAYRKQALQWHPDKHKTDKEAAEKRFKEINEAYQVLSNKDKRAAYDQYGHSAFSPGGSAPGGAGFGGFGGGNPFGGGNGQWHVYTSGNGGAQNFDFGDPFEIFSQFFGGGNPFGGARRQVPRYSMTIDFMEAVNGVEKEVNIEGKKRTIKIPAGINEGQRIQFGDFSLSVNIRPHELFERDGSDVYLTLRIPYSMLVLGGEVEVPTVDRAVKIKIKKGTQSGTTMRLRGKGIKDLHGRGYGDEYVKLQAAVPDRLTREQKSLIEELGEQGF